MPKPKNDLLITVVVALLVIVIGLVVLDYFVNIRPEMARVRFEACLEAGGTIATC